MKKTILITVSILMMVLYILIMSSGFLLKNPITEDDDVIKHIDLVQQSAIKNNWEESGIELEKAFKAWGKVKNRIQFSVERVFIEDIDEEFATLKGIIKAKDTNMAIITTEKIKTVWDELGR